MAKSKAEASVPTKIELLLEMCQLQKDCFSLLSQAESAKGRGELDSAIESYDGLISLSKKHLKTALLHNRHHPEPVDIVLIVGPLLNAIHTQADLQQCKGNLDKAEALRSEALAISREHQGSSGTVEAKRGQAAALTSQGRFNEALVNLTACRDLCLQEGDPVQLARVTIDMVDILQWLGDNNRALSELNHAAAVISPLVSEDHSTLAGVTGSVLAGLSGILTGGGDGKGAQEAFAIYRILTEIKYYRGLINKALGRFEDADADFRSVYSDYQRMGVGPAIEYQFACILLGTGRYQEALDYSEGLEVVFVNDGRLRAKLAGVLKIQAEALLELGRSEEALEKLQRGISDLEVHFDPDLQWKLQWLRGRILESMGRSKKALEAYADSAETVKNLRKASLGYRLDSTYLRDKLELYESAIDLAYRSDLAKQCCDFIAMIKARALGITLSIANRAERSNGDSLGEDFDRLTQELDCLEYRGYLEGQTAELRQRRASVLAERTELLERIRFSDPRWRSMTEPVDFDLDEVVSVLGERDQAALDLFYRPNQIVAILLKDGECTVGSVKVREEIGNRLKSYQRNLQLKYPDPNLYDISAGLAIGAKHLVPAELLRQGIEAKELIVVPHGPLHLIPWASLVFDGNRMFEYCPVGVVPNLSCIVNLGDGFSNEPKVALVGSPEYGKNSFLKHLPEAEKEIEAIGHEYAKRGRIIGDVLTGSRAREEDFWELANHDDAEGGILHIACHGTIEADEPMNSGLLLSDSKVDAAEITLSSLKYDEVVLSACSSGWRPMEIQDVELSGDDILGLPGAFLEAGIKSVLVSIPKADDTVACRFMVLYHQNRLDGKTPLVALQATQKAMISGIEGQPFAGAGFTVYGCR